MAHKQNYNAIIIYGTGGGNSLLVSEAIQSGLQESGVETDLKRVELTNVDEIKEFDLVVMVSSTWNEGELQDNFVPFYEEFIEAEGFEGELFAVVGLGDSENYDVYNTAADILEEAVAKVGGTLLVDPLKVDGDPYERLDNYKMWGEELADVLLEHSESEQ
jgi:flavodoxin